MPIRRRVKACPFTRIGRHPHKCCDADASGDVGSLRHSQIYLDLHGLATHLRALQPVCPPPRWHRHSGGAAREALGSQYT